MANPDAPLFFSSTVYHKAKQNTSRRSRAGELVCDDVPGIHPIPVSVDSFTETDYTRMKQDPPSEENLINYANTLIDLRRQDVIIGFHSIELQKRQIVLDGYDRSLYDWLNGESQKPSSWFFKSGQDGFEFSKNFGYTFKVMTSGITLLYRSGKSYTDIQLDTIAFYEDDTEWRTPKFLDMFDLEGIQRKDSKIWKKLGKILEQVISELRSREQPSNTPLSLTTIGPNLRSFIDGLKNTKMEDAEKLIEHPALMEDEEKIGKIVQLHGKNCLNSLNNKDFNFIVCQGMSWKDVAYIDPHFQVMIDYKMAMSDKKAGGTEADYGEDIVGCVRMMRNTSVHLNENLWKVRNRGRIGKTKYNWRMYDGLSNSLSQVEIERSMERTFPKLISHLYEICDKKTWVK